MSRRVYATVIERASLIVRGGHGVIADAVFARASDRDDLEQAASAAECPSSGSGSPRPCRSCITRSERRQSDASDAGADVIRRQLNQDTGVITWQRIDASSAPSHVLTQATALLNERLKTG